MKFERLPWVCFPKLLLMLFSIMDIKMRNSRALPLSGPKAISFWSGNIQFKSDYCEICFIFNLNQATRGFADGFPPSQLLVYMHFRCFLRKATWLGYWLSDGLSFQTYWAISNTISGTKPFYLKWPYVIQSRPLLKSLDEFFFFPKMIGLEAFGR